MTTVYARPGEQFDELLKRFRRKVQGDNILTTVRRKRFFVPKSELRRKAKQRAVRKARRHQRQMDRRDRY